MTTNVSYEYTAAEKKYSIAKTMEEKIAALEEMISHAPAHKGGENLRKELHARIKRFREKQEKSRKTGKSTQKTIKKEGFQCVLVGFTNSGKSSLLAKLTNAKPKTSENQFTTKQPEVGTMDYYGVKAQIVDIPSLGSEMFQIGLVNTADCLLVVVENYQDLERIKPMLSRTYGKIIPIINKSDLLSEEQLRKLKENLKSKRIEALIISSQTGQGLEELKEKIFKSMESIRIYTKEPGKQASQIPIVMKPGSTVRDIAEKILKGLSKRIKESRVTGPSSKFPNQIVGLSHILKDKDIVEFKTN